MKKSKKSKQAKRFVPIIIASTMALSPVFPTFASAQGTKTQPLTAVQTQKSINLVDWQATANTKSLFAYLNDIRGKHVLFGDQHATDEGLTLKRDGSFESDVYNSVGDFPAVFGWDTLSLEGKEKPGVPNDLTQSRANLTASMKAAHEKGGIVALSSHMPNFVTGGSFNDTTGSVVEHILPGGDKNVEFNAFLDNLAAFATNLKDDDGNLIPVLFRPFHEQNGGWFWWGAKTTSTSQYKEIYRYTVEYLRDKKGVHNFLYVFSPNGTFGGSQDSYLTTYPGDDYVDILGMDQYDNQDNPGSQNFLNNLVKDLGMISKVADSKGKIATFSEFGYSPQGMKTTGNGDLNWFTDVMNAIKADPDAKRISYMQTWANFALNGNLFVPYNDAPNGLGDHELLSDFIKYYNDDYTSFLNEVEGVNSFDVTAEAENPFMHVVSPTASSTITTATTKIRAKVLHDNPSKVTYTVTGSTEEVPMTVDQDGYYSADWAVSPDLNGKSADITVKTYGLDGSVVKEETVKVFLKVAEIVAKQFTFDTGIEGIKNNGTYPETITSNFEYASLAGDGKLKINVSGLNKADTWQELKLELDGIANQVNLDAVRRVKFDVLLPAAAKTSSSANASIRGVVMLPPDWDTKYGMATSEKKLSELPTVEVAGEQYLKYPVSIDVTDAAKLEAATSLALSIVGSGLEFNGSAFVDNIQLVSTYVEAPKDPTLVDDFEFYQGDSAALAAKFVHAGGDATTVSLDTANESGGSYAMKFDYTLAGSGYAGISKSLGGVDWSGANKLKFWLVPDGKNQKMVIQLKVDGVSYEAYPSLAGTEGRWEEIHFNDFTVAPWDTANAGKKLNKVSLKNVQDFNIYVNSVNGAELSSSLYFDDIKAINDGTGGVSNGGTGPGSYPEQPGTLYDFETDTQGWSVEQNQADATIAAVTNEAAAKGTNSLTSTFDLTKAGGFELTKVQAADLSAVKKISAKVKLSAGTANARLYIKTGSNWDWHDSGVVAVDSNGFATLSIDLNPAWGLDALKSIGVKVEPTSGTGTAAVYVDDVALSAGDVVDPGTTDNEAPVVTGVVDGGSYNKDVTITFNEGTATLDGQPFANFSTVKTEGPHTLVVTDEAGNSTTVKFTIDKKTPVISGVINNGYYNKSVTVSFNKGTAKLNEKTISNKTVVSAEGKYTLEVTDQAGNKTTVKFTIDKKAPVVSGVVNNGLYNKSVTVSFNEGTAKLNGKTISNKTVVSAQGNYTLDVTDQAGNKKIVKFTIDKTAPASPKINTVTDYSVKVTGKTQASAIVKLYIAGKYQRAVSADKNGSFTFTISKQKAGTAIKVTATDKAGNTSTTTVKVVDKTAPAAPKVNKVTVKSTKVTGKAEAGSRVIVKAGSKVIGKAYADKYGHFSIKISKQLASKVLSITATDKAGNVSSVKKVTVKK